MNISKEKWCVVEDDEYIQVCRLEDGMGATDEICSIKVPGNPRGREQAIAIAHKIAGAPEMYAALYERVEDCNEGQSGTGCGMGGINKEYRNHSIYCVRARKAIAKAEGK